MAHSGYRLCGPYFVPAGGDGARLYWRHVHPARRRALARLAALWPRPPLLRRPPASLDWAEAVERSLRARLGGEWTCVWRPESGGRPAVGWIGNGAQLRAVVRVAFGDAAAGLQREQRALAFLARVPGLAESVPRILWSAAEPGGPTLLLESACAGRACTEADLALQDLCAPAAWLGRFQAWTARPAEPGAVRAWREELHEAILRHPGLMPAVRVRLLQRVAAVPVPRMAAAHGDFRWGNLLWGEGGRVAVLHWSRFEPREHPLQDAAVFLLTLARDLAPRERRAAAEFWLDRAFTPGTPFHAWARRWFELYRWDTGWTARFDRLLDFLPLAMARLACRGPGAEAWTAACNSIGWR